MPLGLNRAVSLSFQLIGSFILDCKQLVINDTEFEKVHCDLGVKVLDFRVLFEKLLVAVFETAFNLVSHGFVFWSLICLGVILVKGKHIADVLDNGQRRWVIL